MRKSRASLRRANSAMSRGSKRSYSKRSFTKRSLPYSQTDLKKPFYDSDGDVMGLVKSSHWREIKPFNNKTSFLLEDDLEDSAIDETVKKFVNCVNLLYFDDSTVAKKMNNVIRTEMKYWLITSERKYFLSKLYLKKICEQILSKFLTATRLFKIIFANNI